MSRELQLEKKDGSKIWTRFALSKVSAEGKFITWRWYGMPA